MNNNIYREKKRFNVIDAMIILLAVIMLFVLIFRARIISLFTGTGAEKDCTVSFICTSIPNDLSGLVQNGDTLVWLEAESELGKLTKTAEPTASDIYYEDNGELYWKQSQTTMKFSGTIDCAAVYNQGCYIDGTDFLAAGMVITVSTGTVQFEVLITNIVFAE